MSVRTLFPAGFPFNAGRSPEETAIALTEAINSEAPPGRHAECNSTTITITVGAVMSDEWKRS